MKRLCSSNKTATTLMVVSAFAVLCAFSAGAAAPSKSKSAQKIDKLKQELVSATGQKRAKLIKKIAEMENKVLEHKIKSFR